MNPEVYITCAVTGDDTMVAKSPHCAITPEQIAQTAIEAAQAGAAIAHIHVRDPETGAFSMETRHYREVVKRIRENGTDVIVNLTCGMGGYIVVGENGLQDTPAPGSDFVTQEERMKHVIDLCHEGLYRPDILTLDCGSLNFGDANRAYRPRISMAFERCSMAEISAADFMPQLYFSFTAITFLKARAMTWASRAFTSASVQKKL